MAKKKDRSFFICPQWSEIPGVSADGLAWRSIDAKTIAAIAAGRPVARSTLRAALMAVRWKAGTVFDVDAFIVDQRRVKAS